MSPLLSPHPDRFVVVERCYASAYDALMAGNDEAANRLFMAMALMAPRDERAWIGLAVIRERRGEVAAAAGLYGLGATLAPSPAWCHLGRARNLAMLGKTQMASRSLDAAEMASDDPVLLNAVAQERGVS